MREQVAPGRFSSPKKRPGPEATISHASNTLARVVGGGEKVLHMKSNRSLLLNLRLENS